MSRKRIAWWLRGLVDRIDGGEPPRAIGWSFTFEEDIGISFHQDRRGCPLWYLSEADYDRAHTEARTKPAIRAYREP